jgi:DNA-directed RNA polymerase specialized sigma24 family protein
MADTGEQAALKVAADAPCPDLQPDAGEQVDVCAPEQAPFRPEDVRRLIDSTDEVGRRLLENLERRAADQCLVDALAREGFNGSRWLQVETELIRYGISTLSAWLYTGFVFKLIADRGMNIVPTDREMNQLRDDRDLRVSIAGHTVAVALPKFREQALLRGGWTFAGGASLTTYFMGATAYTFPNEFRRWRREHARSDREDPAGLVVDLAAAHPDSASQALGQIEMALGQIEVEETLGRLKPREVAIVRLHLAGYTHQEVAEMLSDSSVKAIEGVLYRWRKSEQKQRRCRDSREDGDSRG